MFFLVHIFTLLYSTWPNTLVDEAKESAFFIICSSGNLGQIVQLWLARFLDYLCIFKHITSHDCANFHVPQAQSTIILLNVSRETFMHNYWKTHSCPFECCTERCLGTFMKTHSTIVTSDQPKTNYLNQYMCSIKAFVVLRA